MKIRSSYELVNFLDSALAWRKKEITTLHFQVINSRRVHEKEALMRSSCLILYAHWEGFVKDAAVGYLEFVSRQKLKYSELKTNFVALCCRPTIRELAQNSQIYLHTQLIDFFIYNQNDRARIPYIDVLETESNLSSRVLKNILNLVGLSFDDYWQSKSFALDGALLSNRNKIAHGERQSIDFFTYQAVHDLVTEAINKIRDDIESAALSNAYKR